MAVVQTKLKVTHQSAAIKVAGTAGAATISLANLLPHISPIYGVGTISTANADKTVTGVGTAFVAGMVGAEIYDTTGALIGVVDTVTNGLALELVDDAAVIVTTADYGIAYASQVIDGDPEVSITGVGWAGDTDGVISIARNSVVVMTLQANAAGYLDFGGQGMIPDTVEKASDIVVTISGAQAECWLTLRKLNGYQTTVQPEQFGVYDNPAVVGS